MEFVALSWLVNIGCRIPRDGDGIGVWDGYAGRLQRRASMEVASGFLFLWQPHHTDSNNHNSHLIKYTVFSLRASDHQRQVRAIPSDMWGRGLSLVWRPMWLETTKLGKHRGTSVGSCPHVDASLYSSTRARLSLLLTASSLKVGYLRHFCQVSCRVVIVLESSHWQVGAGADASTLSNIQH